MKPNLKREVAKLDDAIKILRHMRETWGLLLEKIATEGYEGTAEEAMDEQGMLSAEEILEGYETGSRICLEG